MRDRDGAVLGQKQKRRRFADQDGPSNHDHMLAGQVVAECAFGQDHTAGRRAGPHAGFAEHQTPGARLGQAVNILVGIDLLDCGRFVEAFRQGQLQQDAVDLIVVIQTGNQRLDVRLAGISRQMVMQGSHAAFLGLAHLVAHIDLAGRIFTDQDHRERRLPRQRVDRRFHACAHISGNLFS